jgi:hypothetical protein
MKDFSTEQLAPGQQAQNNGAALKTGLWALAAAGLLLVISAGVGSGWSGTQLGALQVQAQNAKEGVTAEEPEQPGSVVLAPMKTQVQAQAEPESRALAEPQFTRQVHSGQQTEPMTALTGESNGNAPEPKTAENPSATESIQVTSCAAGAATEADLGSDALLSVAEGPLAKMMGLMMLLMGGVIAVVNRSPTAALTGALGATWLLVMPGIIRALFGC